MPSFLVLFFIKIGTEFAEILDIAAVDPRLRTIATSMTQGGWHHSVAMATDEARPKGRKLTTAIKQNTSRLDRDIQRERQIKRDRHTERQEKRWGESDR